MDELKQCPFCGGQAHLHKLTTPNKYDPKWNVRCDCDSCIAGVVVRHYEQKEQAIEAWNNRHEFTCQMKLENDDFDWHTREWECSHCGRKTLSYHNEPTFCSVCGAKVVR